MGTGASFTLRNSFSRQKNPGRKIHPEPPAHRSGGPVFGISLSELRESGQMVCGIPWVLKDMVDILEKHGLQQEGLFRVCGSVEKTAKLKARCDRGKPLDASAGGDVQNVASLLKRFLRELPQAVIPDPQRVEISRCFRKFTDELTVNHMLREQLTSLPKDNYNILSYLCHFLLKVASYSQVNHMSVENLATIFGPCLFQVPYGPSMLEEQTLCNAVLCHILKNQSFLMSSGLDSPSPPPVLTALSDPEEKAMGITSVWSSVHESSAETQALDTAETQALDTAEALLPATAETQALDTAEALLPATAETQALDTAEALLPATAETQALDTAEALLPATAETQALDTAETQALDTAETQALDTAEALLPATAETQALDTAEALLPATAETQALDTAETQALDTAETQALDTAEALLPATAETQALDTAETQALDTAETQALDTAETQALDTAETQALDTAEALLPATAETQGQRSASPSLTHIQLAGDEVSRQCVSAALVSEGQDDAAQTHTTTPRSDRAAVGEDQLGSGQNQILQSEKTTSSCDPVCDHRQDFPQDMEVIAEPTDPEGHADTKANGDVFGRDSPHSDRAKLTLPEDDEIPQTPDEEKPCHAKPSGLRKIHPEAFPATETCQEDPPRALDRLEANCTPPPSETVSPAGLDCEGPQGTALGPCQLLLPIANGNTSPLPSPRCPSLSQSLRYHSDPEKAPSPPCAQPFIKARPVTRTQAPDSSADSLAIAMLTKHVQALKKKIRRFEEQFETKRNCKPSHQDKTVNPEVLQLMNDLAKTRRKIRDLRLRESEEQTRPQAAEEPSDMCSNSDFLQGAPEHSQKPSLQDTLELLLERLREKRQALSLPEEIKEMTQKQIALEKITLQKCLLYFEGLHGRPGNKQERTLMKPLYDRYRTVKRLLCAASTLTTIAEEENYDDCSTQRGPLPSSREIHLQLRDDSPTRHSEGSDATFVSPTDEMKTLWQPAVSMSHLHEASRTELQQHLRETRAEKRRLRKTLRELEGRDKKQTGRASQKDDRIPKAEEYQQYKNLKGKLRLLEVLLSKPETSKTA